MVISSTKETTPTPKNNPPDSSKDQPTYPSPENQMAEATTTTVRFTMKPPKTMTAATVNVLKLLQSLFNQAEKADPTIAFITGINDTLTKNNFPKNKVQFSQQFPKGTYSEAIFRGRPTVNLDLKITSALPFHELQASLAPWLTTVNCHLTEIRTIPGKRINIGWLKNVSPNLHHRDHLAQRIIDELSLDNLDDSEQPFQVELVKSTFRLHHSDNAAHSCQALFILVPAHHAQQATDAFAQHYISTPTLPGLYMATGFHLTLPDTTVKTHICEHNNHLQKIYPIPVSGLTHNAITYPLPSQQNATIQDLIHRHSAFQGVEPTNATDAKGKYFFLTTQANKQQAWDYLQHIFQLHQDEIPSEHWHKHHPTP